MGLTDFGAAGEAGTFDHGEDVGGDIAIDDGVVVEVAAGGVKVTVYTAVDVDFTGADVAFDVGEFTDGDLAFSGKDFALYLTVDVHVIDEGDGADDFDTLCENVGGVAHK